MPAQFFQNGTFIYLAELEAQLPPEDQAKLAWLLNAKLVNNNELQGSFVGPRKEMVTPWSTNAVEIAENAGISGINRIEKFYREVTGGPYDPMLEQVYPVLQDDSLVNDREPEAIEHVDDIAAYNRQMGLALSPDEIEYLQKSSRENNRSFTDSEIFGFAQVNSEHCRHKIFNGKFIVDGVEQELSLFQWIKKTTRENPGAVITNYNDNVSFVEGEKAREFAPERPDLPSKFKLNPISTVFSLKAETHNFPTTVEPINGAATGSGGEIRDRMAGGKGSLPLAGTACYMTGYPRLNLAGWEAKQAERPWLYQTPQQILTKASDGASDFGNKFGQPLINGSVLTFEQQADGIFYGFDKTIMLAGGIGYANKRDALKDTPAKGDKIILMGGDNYRIGMGGGAVSSVNTGEFQQKLELNAVQRANPEMQKRVLNALRGLLESSENPIVLIHDHGAGGHINCLSELIEKSGGVIHTGELPVGDPSLSDKELIGNESQERMGLVVKEADVELLRNIADRERAPMYVIGTVTGDNRFIFENKKGEHPVDVSLDFLFGKAPGTVIEARSITFKRNKIKVMPRDFTTHIKNILQLEGVGCKDWLTNKVDRSVTGRVLQQQCVGPLHLPLHGAGVMALDYSGSIGIATAMGSAPVAAIVNAPAGSILSIAEALTNLMFVPLKKGLASITLSANWMWPCKIPGEDARLYQAVKAASEFTIELGINISTGKDSLSMTQAYPDGLEVRSPGTLIVSAMGTCVQPEKLVTPDFKPVEDSLLIHIDFSGSDNHPLGGSALAQTLGVTGNETPDVTSAEYFKNAFCLIQKQVHAGNILAGQDVSSGGVITALLEMAFTGNTGFSAGREISGKTDPDFWFSEMPGAVIQIKKEKMEEFLKYFSDAGIRTTLLGEVQPESRQVSVKEPLISFDEELSSLRSLWFKPSFQLEKFQTETRHAENRNQNFATHPLRYKLPPDFSGQLPQVDDSKGRIRAAIIREKGTNGEREMAYSLYAAGFEVIDVTMTDLTSGREDLSEISFIVFCGGFSNSDVLGSARGWAGVFKYNVTAKKTLDNFFARPDTMSLGVCNGCQLMVTLGLLGDTGSGVSMQQNSSGKFESAFLNVSIPGDNKSIMLKSLGGCRLGIWVAHGEGKFTLNNSSNPAVALKFSHSSYPQNPNGSDRDIAGLVSEDGRHLAMMPHLERSIFPWQWAYLPEELKGKFAATPWLQAFTNARNWIENKAA